MAKDSALKNRRYANSKTEKWLTYVGDFPITNQFLGNKSYNSGWALIKLFHALLRGYGQIVFSNNPISGAIIFIALFWGVPASAPVGLFSAVIGLLTSILLGLPSCAIDNGLTIFNNILLGLVSSAILPGKYGIEFSTEHWFYVALMSVLCVFVFSAISSFLEAIGKLRLLCLAIPFNIVQFMLLAVVIHMNPNTTTLPSNETTILVPGPVAVPALDLITSESQFIPDLFAIDKINRSEPQVEANFTHENIEIQFDEIMLENDTFNDANRTSHMGFTRRKRDALAGNLTDTQNAEKMTLEWDRIIGGILLSMSQVFGVCHLPAALLIYVAVIICSPLTAVYALTGAILGTSVGIVLSNSPYMLLEVYDGVWGFNGLLCSAALGGFLFVATWQSTFTAFSAAIFATLAQRVLGLILDQANMPVMSLPFNVGTLLFLCIAASDDPRYPRPDDITFPEKHLYLYQEKMKQERLEPSFLPSSNFENHEELSERRAPLAEQEVV